MHLTPLGGIMGCRRPLGRRTRVDKEENFYMSAEENNMALARRLMEARVKGDLDALDEMMSPDFVSHAKLLPDQQPDREGEKWLAVQLAAAFSNRRLLVEDQVAGGDKVVTRFIVHVTHDRGEFRVKLLGYSFLP
jgi:ketosteroid isomerase-like protein